MKHKIALLLLLAFVAVSLLYVSRSKRNKGTDKSLDQITTEMKNISQLILPFHIADIDNNHAELNPLGVVRFSRDVSAIGHSGIDIPMRKGANIYAVSDGEIVLIESTGDDWGGMKIFQLLEKTGSGEGIAFIYDHVTPTQGLKVGDSVVRGQVIAHKTPPEDFTAHFQLSRVFNNYKYVNDIQCWPNYLSGSERVKLDSWWNKYRDSNVLIGAWRTNKEEGKYPFRGLLDKSKYPNGPQLCYALGTDVR